jgi:uncharacterized protein (TIGR01319 family)
MSNVKLLIDFGSTFTKVIAIDPDEKTIIARAQVPSTVDKDITIGLKQALEKIDIAAHTNGQTKSEALACSSAAGGLRIVSIGFVPELTSEAATRAALGAGAKVVGCFSYEITTQELDEIKQIAPDIILLAGGTDGGDKKVIIHNAHMLSQMELDNIHVLVAGNKTAQDDIKEIFKESGNEITFTKNVMPEIGKLDTEHCNQAIRKIFIKNIIETKGIAKAKEIVKDIIMPTPSAVLAAAKLLAEGHKDEKGFGDLVVVDIGGATTDIHSISKGVPSRKDIVMAGLPEPYVKRTVEGDLGVRLNIATLIELLQMRGILPDERYDTAIREISKAGTVPETEAQFSSDMLLASIAVEVAMERHAGKIDIVYTPQGEMAVQRGKDLAGVKCVIGTGGPIVFSRDPGEILKKCLFQDSQPHILRPQNPRFLLDNNYILYAAGLLSQSEPDTALALMKKYLREV